MAGELKTKSRPLTGAQILGKLNALGAVGAAFADDVFAVKGSSDATKNVRLEVDGLTTATTRVWTAPDSNLTVAGIDLAQTFTAAQTFSAAVTLDAASSGLTIAKTTGTTLTVSSTSATSVTLAGGISIGGALTCNSASPTFTLGDGTGTPVVSINGATAVNRDITYRTAGSRRWAFRCNNTAEAGANAGSDFALTAFDDTGSTLVVALTVTRATGLLTLGAGLTVPGAVSLTTASSGLTISKTTGTTLVVSSTTDATTTTAASVTLAGGLAVAKAIISGSLGVNAAPSQTFTAQTTAFVPGVQVQGISNETSALAAARWANNVNGPRWFLAKSRGASVGTFAVVQSGDRLGGIFWNGDDGTAFREAAAITAEVDGTPGASDMPGRLLFFTSADGSSTLTEAARIDNTGLLTLSTSSAGLTIAKTTGTTLVVSSTAATCATFAGGATFGNTVTVTGNVVIDAANALIVQGNAATNREYYWRTGTSARWIMRCNNVAESGSDAGSNWELSARTDAGAVIDTPFTILRATGGAMTITRPVTISTASSGLTIAKTTGTTLSVSSTDDSTSLITGCAILQGGLAVNKRLTLDGATGKTLRIVNGVANAAVAVTFGAVGPTGSTAGNQQGWMRVDINGTDRYIPYW